MGPQITRNMQLCGYFAGAFAVRLYQSRNPHVIEHIHGKDNSDFPFREPPYGCLPVKAVFTFFSRPAEYSGGRDASFTELPGHVRGMLSGTAEAQGPVGSVLHIVAVDQVIAPYISDISLVQFLFVIAAPDQMETGIVSIIIDAVVAEGTQDSPVDGIPEGDFIWNVVIAEFIDIPASIRSGVAVSPSRNLGLKK